MHYELLQLEQSSYGQSKNLLTWNEHLFFKFNLNKDFLSRVPANGVFREQTVIGNISFLKK